MDRLFLGLAEPAGFRSSRNRRIELQTHFTQPEFIRLFLEGNTMKKELKKVSLSKETILRLTPADLSRGVFGASVTCLPGEGWSDNSVCPTTTPSNCKPCN